jgi:hypothetical protein
MLRSILFFFFIILNISNSQEIVKDTTIVNGNLFLRNSHLLQFNDYLYLSGFSSSLRRDTTSTHLTKVDKQFNFIWDSKTNKYDSLFQLFSEFSFVDAKGDINSIASYGSIIQWLFFERIDTSGNVVFQIDSANLRNNFLGGHGSLFKNHNNEIFYCYGLGSNKSGRLMLLSFDINCKFIKKDTIFFMDTVNYNEISAKSSILTKDSGYVVSGTFYNRKMNKYDLFLHKYNKNSKLIWEKIFKSDSATQTPSQLLETSTGEIMLVGFLRPFPSTINKATHFVRKFNNTGNLIWDKSFIENIGVTMLNIFESNNGNFYLIANTLQKLLEDPPDAYYNFCLLKITGNGDLIWEKTWGMADVNNYLTGLVFDKNNDIIVSGNQGIYTYIARIKDTTTTSISDLFVSEKCLIISPNPSNSFIDINFSNKNILLNLNQINIYNSIGEIVLSISILNPDSQRIDISSLPPGLYFVRYGSEYAKFIKE